MIYLMRHGLDDETFIGGWSNVDLVEEGIEQVNKTAIYMKENDIKITKIISSNVKRAVTTANIVKNYYPDVEILKDSLFREQNKGIYNGKNKEISEKNNPHFFSSITIDTVYEGGESLRDLYNRVSDYLEYLLSLEDGTLIITHRGVINMLYYILNNIELDMDKKKFNVTHASLHELDKTKKYIRKVF